MSYNWFRKGTNILNKRFLNAKEFNEMKIVLASNNDNEAFETLSNDLNSIYSEVSNLKNNNEYYRNAETQKQSILRINTLQTKYELPSGFGGARFYQDHLVGKENMSGAWTEIVLPIGNRKIGDVFVLTICRPSFIDRTIAWNMVLDTRYWIHQVVDNALGIKNMDSQYNTTDPRTTQIQTATSVIMQPSYNIRYFVFEWLGFGIGWNLSRSFDSIELPLASY